MARLPNKQIQDDVASVFLSYFNRAPEFQAMEWYANLYTQLLVDQGDDPAARDNAFKALSAQVYVDGVGTGEVPTGPLITNEWYVDYIYNNVLGRDADEEGFDYWVAELDAGSIERSELIGIVLDAAQNYERDAAYVNNRTEVAVAFSQWENSNPQILDSLQYNAAEVLIGVNEDRDTVDAAMARLNENTGQVGETFTLTKSIDDFEGTSYDDTFNAYYEDTSTLTPFDNINGNGGWDVLNIYTDGTHNTFVPGTASIVNVEEVNIFNSAEELSVNPGSGNKALTDAAAYEGVRELWQTGQALSVTNLGVDTLAGFRSLDLDEGVTVATTKAAASATVNLDNVSGENDDTHPALIIEGAEDNESLSTFIVLGSLAADAEDLHLTATVGKDVTTAIVNTEVATELTLKTVAGAKVITTLDAFGSTGDVQVKADTLTAVTMGAGDDLIIFAGAPELKQSIDGGEGIDLVAMGQANFQTQDYDAINQMENIEGLIFFGDGAKVDAEQVEDYLLLGIGQMDDAFNGAIISNLSADQTVFLLDENVVTLTLLNADADVKISVGEESELTLAVGVVEEGKAAKLGDQGGRLILDGEGSVEFDNGQVGGSVAANKFSTIDASWLEGGLTLTGMAVGVTETIILEGSEEGVSDVITITVASDGAESSSTIGSLDVIENFDSTSNAKDELRNGENDVVGDFVNDEDEWDGVNTLFEAWAAAATYSATEGASAIVYFHFEGSTYLYSDTFTAEGSSAGKYDNDDFALKVVGEHDFSA